MGIGKLLPVLYSDGVHSTQGVGTEASAENQAQTTAKKLVSSTGQSPLRLGAPLRLAEYSKPMQAGACWVDLALHLQQHVMADFHKPLQI